MGKGTRPNHIKMFQNKEEKKRQKNTRSQEIDVQKKRATERIENKH